MAGRTLVVLLGAMTAAACAVTPPASTDGRLPVVATTSAWGSVLAQIGGARIHATSLVANPNADPHDYEPTPADARALSVARLVVENGVGYDAWADRVLAASPDSRRIVLDVGALAGVSGDGNPHLWYSPADVEMLAGSVARALARLDPSGAAYYARQREHFDTQGLARYHALIAELRARYADVAVGASESIAVPLAHALGLKLRTPPDLLRAISEGSDPSAADKATVDAQIRDHRIAAFIVNPQNSTPDVTAEAAAARAAGIPVVEMTETLTPAGASFQDWQVAQLIALRAALHRATGR